MHYNTSVHSTRSSKTINKTDFVKVTLTLSRLFLVLVNCAMVMLIAPVLKEVKYIVYTKICVRFIINKRELVLGDPYVIEPDE